jgi:hypothetical protein
MKETENLSKITKQLNNTYKNINLTIDNFTKLIEVIKLTDESVSGLINNSVLKLNESISKLGVALKESSGGFEKFKKTMSETSSNVSSAMTVFTSFFLLVREGAQSGALLSAGIMAAIPVIISLIDWLIPAGKSLEELNEIYNTSTERINKQRVALAQSITSLSTLEAIKSGFININKLSSIEQEDFNNLLKNASVLYPQIIKGVDEHTGSLQLNSKELDILIQKENEVAKIREQAIIANQVSVIEKFLDENESLLNSYESLKEKLEILEKQGVNTWNADKITDFRIKINEAENSSGELHNMFMQILTEAGNFGELNDVIALLKPVIEENSGATKIFFDVIHSFTGQAVNDWNAVIQAVKNYKNESVSTYIPKPGDYDVPLPPGFVKKSNAPKIYSRKRTNEDEDVNKELNFLEQLRENIKKIQFEISELTDLGTSESLHWYEKLAITEELIKKNRELNELTKTNFQNLTAKTSADIKDIGSEVVREPSLKLSGGGTFKKLEGVINPHLEFAKRMQDIYDGMANGVMGSMGSLFASLVPPQAALSPLEQFMKQIVITFINAVQGLVLAAAAALPAKGITTFGISMITDAPLLAAAYAALEIAKGFIGGFAKGTDYLHKSGYALVGEQGPELVYLNRGAKVFNNNDTSKMLNSARANTVPNTNVNNVYISSSLDALSFFRVNYPKYKKFKRLQSN